MCVTSPPYLGLRNYGHPNEFGREATIECYIGNLVEVFGRYGEFYPTMGLCG